MKNIFNNRIEEDLRFRDLMIGSSVKPHESEPTKLSLQNIIFFVERKYGKDWRSFPDAKCIVIWSSWMFVEEHIKSVVPDLYDLCIEYKTEETINGHELPEDFFMLPFSLFESPLLYEGLYGTSPVSDAYFKLEKT